MTTITAVDLELEKKEILKRYKHLLRSMQGRTNLEDRKIIRKAFDLAVESHKDMRRKSGEPYIYHPLAVAQICADEIGLGATAIVCALLHDVVEDTEITIEDIKRLFGEKTAMIIDGLTKISGVFDQRSSQQAENFRKMLLTLSDDVRVILIKLADRLHNMRTLDSMARDKQLKIASETLYMYAPLAHRLGLYAIKTELEDLGLKYTEPETYQMIVDKLRNTEDVRKRFINRFTMPIKKSLAEQGLEFEIKGRPKSVFSIWNKVTKKGVPFEEIYDIFAIRIIIESKPENEKADCWKVYSMVTDFYKPSPERLRDWISTPRANGYESLHTTVMSPTGKWVEVQIRTRRMDDIAEKGYAAHWLYKEGSKTNSESNIDSWLKRIREMIENSDGNALEFIDEFKLNLFSEEIFIFTPKGELKTLPANSTALDFAYEVHSQIGNSCIGAKVNNKLVPLSHPLKSGDQIEIITSSKQRPKEDWLGYVVTAKAKGRIKSALKEEKRALAEEGRAMLERKLNHLKLKPDGELLNRLAKNYKVHSVLDLFHDIAVGHIDLKTIQDNLEEKKETSTNRFLNLLRNPFSREKAAEREKFEDMVTSLRGKDSMLVIGENLQKIDYKLAPCCNPIPGDEVFGFITINEGIKIHKTNCPNAISLMSNYAYRIVKAKWIDKNSLSFLSALKVTGFDDVGIVNNITRIISNEQHLNMRSISFDSNDGIFEGNILVFVNSTEHLNSLIQKLKKVEGVKSVYRVDGTESS